MATVEDGDCITSLAAKMGVRDYRTLWDANTALKGKRANPNMLVIGDTVDEPPKTKKESKENGKRWTYVIKPKTTASLRVIVLGPDEKPLEGATWELTAPVAKNGTTLANGLIEILDFPPQEKAAALKVTPKPPTPPTVTPVTPPTGPPPYPAPINATQFKDKVRAAEADDAYVEWTLKVGSVPAFDHETGVLARLNNLGAACAPGDDGSRTARTVKSYQKAFLNQQSGSGLPADIQTDLRDRHDKKP